MGRSLSIELVLEPGRERLECRLVGPAASGRRHRAAPDLLHDFFPHVGTRADMPDVQLIQQESGGLQALVVARHAVLLHES